MVQYDDSFGGEHIHFVTGRLAAHALERTVERLAQPLGFRYTIQVLPITVAALMTPRWVARHLELPSQATKLLLPGYCRGPLEPLEAVCPVPILIGPTDLYRLPRFFGQSEPTSDDCYDIEIIAEINHAPRYSPAELAEQAKQLAREGADVIDVGCEPEGGWSGIADAVRALKEEGLRVSVDSLDPREIEPAVAAGAELVLSVNHSNRKYAPSWNCPVVVIPDRPQDLESLYDTVEFLATENVPQRLDPILEPIGCGFASSLGRYLEVRRRYPDAEMLMGIGNLTEMTDADSAPINVLLLGFCQELGIRSVLTTQVIHWARTSVRECDLARRLVFQAAQRGTPPKHVDTRLLLLRDEDVAPVDPDFADQLAQSIRDHHVRVLADTESLHMISANLHVHDTDPFTLFRKFLDAYPRTLDAAHAFYLGYELAKATTAMTLGKQYTQDEPLDWGFLTRDESTHTDSQPPNRHDSDID